MSKKSSEDPEEPTEDELKKRVFGTTSTSPSGYPTREEVIQKKCSLVTAVEVLVVCDYCTVTVIFTKEHIYRMCPHEKDEIESLGKVPVIFHFENRCLFCRSGSNGSRVIQEIVKQIEP